MAARTDGQAEEFLVAPGEPQAAGHPRRRVRIARYRVQAGAPEGKEGDQGGGGGEPVDREHHGRAGRGEQYAADCGADERGGTPHDRGQGLSTEQHLAGYQGSGECRAGGNVKGQPGPPQARPSGR